MAKTEGRGVPMKKDSRRRCVFCGIVMAYDHVKDYCQGCQEDIELDLPAGSWKKRQAEGGRRAHEDNSKRLPTFGERRKDKS